MSPRPRHDREFGQLQPERTALAWERTAIAMMVAGVIFVRQAAINSYSVVGLVGMLQTLLGAALLVWAGLNYEDLGHQLREETSVTRHTATSLLGLATLVFIGASLILTIVIAFE